jgi:integrase
MARTVRDAKLESRAAREKLGARGKPYYRTLDPGLHLGYRKLKGAPGRWVVRFYEGEQAYTVETIATADDLSTANGVDVLDFQQAQQEARKLRDVRVRDVAGIGGPFTVAVAIERYLEALEARGRNSADTRVRAEKMILPALGNVEVAHLTTDRIRHWIMKLAAMPPRLRTAKGEEQRFRTVSDDRETTRRRRSTANRYASILFAALSHAFREGHVSSDQAWRRVKLFENVTSARVRYLTVAEAQRLLNGCDPDFRDLVQAALQSGCRYGELRRLRVRDFNPDSGTVAVLQSKSGKPRHVVLTEEGAAFFSHLCAGRAGDELLLRKSNGAAWGESHQILPMAEACARARIKPSMGFHGLRHTYASLSIMNGAPLMVVAETLGHADTRMVQKHYGHLAQSYVADAIRAAAPRFGTVEHGNVRPLSHGAARR